MRKCKKDKKMILILGNSHAQQVQYNLGQQFEVQAIVKPGANNETKVNTTNSELTRLTKKDVNIIQGGT
jgi:hypothetical protein